VGPWRFEKSYRFALRRRLGRPVANCAAAAVAVAAALRGRGPPLSLALLAPG